MSKSVKWSKTDISVLNISAIANAINGKIAQSREFIECIWIKEKLLMWLLLVNLIYFDNLK